MSLSDSHVSIPFFKPSVGKEEEEAVINVLRSGWLSTAKEALAFEKEFSEFIKAKHCLAVNSNTSGLVLAMEACGIKPGTKILTTPYTFISTATSALHLGGEVVYADIEKEMLKITHSFIARCSCNRVTGSFRNFEKIASLSFKSSWVREAIKLYLTNKCCISICANFNVYFTGVCYLKRINAEILRKNNFRHNAKAF